MAEASLRLPPQVSAADWLKTLPPAARWVLHGNAQARALAAPVWGVGFSETGCGSRRSGARATLWLGPDEYLLLDLAAHDEPDRTLAAAASISISASRNGSRSRADSRRPMVDFPAPIIPTSTTERVPRAAVISASWDPPTPAVGTVSDIDRSAATELRRFGATYTTPADTVARDSCNRGANMLVVRVSYPR